MKSGCFKCHYKEKYHNGTFCFCPSPSEILNFQDQTLYRVEIAHTRLKIKKERRWLYTRPNIIQKGDRFIILSPTEKERSELSTTKQRRKTDLVSLPTKIERYLLISLQLVLTAMQSVNKFRLSLKKTQTGFTLLWSKFSLSSDQGERVTGCKVLFKSTIYSNTTYWI